MAMRRKKLTPVTKYLSILPLKFNICSVIINLTLPSPRPATHQDYDRPISQGISYRKVPSWYVAWHEGRG